MPAEMSAEILSLDRANMEKVIEHLAKQGFEIERLDWKDPHSTETSWIHARITTELDPSGFFNWVAELVAPFGKGVNVVEAGFAVSERKGPLK
jgi:hypothetical protein